MISKCLDKAWPAILGLTLSFAPASCADTGEARSLFKFDFGSGEAAPGYTQVLPVTKYDAERGYGFEDISNIVEVASGIDPLRGDFVTSGKPFYFSVRVPEGNYRVSLVLGDQRAESTTTVKAEARRLMLEKVQTKAGEFVTCAFTVAVKSPVLRDGRSVGLKASERDNRDWDDLLTLEFNDVRPAVCAVEITRVDDVRTVYLSGDSTVTNQRDEPWAAWGQMLPRFFGPGVAVSNHAQSGESLHSFIGERRLQKISETIRPGDYLFIQFGHNDQKDKSPGAGPFTSYKANLKKFISAARDKEAIPVLVTPMERRRFSGTTAGQTLADYAEAVRQAAQEENVPVIDLNALSLKLYQALGPENSKKAFVHYPAGTFPGQDAALKDDTHFNGYGAYQLAKIVAQGIKTEVPALAKSLAEGLPAYDPTQPDALENWSLPLSGSSATTKPEGN
jgi:lysophospholipase L1-like esterase